MAAAVAAELRRADRSPRHLRPRTSALGRQRVPALAIARQVGAAANRFRRLRRRLREKTPLHAPGTPRAGEGRRANRANVATRRWGAPRCSALARPRRPARRARARPAPCGIPRSAEPLLSHLPPGSAGQPDAAIPERSRCTTDDERPRAAAQGIARRVEPQASVIKFPLMQMASTAARFRLRQFLSLTKPRVVSLIVFCAVIGMFLAVPGMVPPKLLLAATIGIWLVAGAAAAVNCLVEQKIDAVMTLTRERPLPRGELTSLQTRAFAGAVGGTGLWMLYALVNPRTMWLTFATFIGYAVIYTVVLKPMTPQNIVIGGASGAMPPVLGWAAVTGEVAPEALLLFLIIFAWTPPHFWALALYRTEEFAKAGLPMLPVTHGHRFTRLYVLLYTLILFASALLPFAYGMSGWTYLAAAVVLNGIFLGYAVRLYTNYSDALARRTFRYSIAYLAALFAALLVDHHLFA